MARTGAGGGGSASQRFDRTVLIICASLSIIARILPIPVREPIANALRRTLLAPMVVLQERAELSRRAFLEHESIARARDSVALRAFDSTDIVRENAQLREIIGLGSRLKWGFVPAEALHGRGVRDEFSVILSAGSNSDVERLSPVVAPQGLVGVVDNVDPTMSHAMLWTNSDFRVSAMTADASAFGIVQAHVANGPGKYLMEMRGVPFRTSVKPGTIIVTSGLGGVYPRGVPLGTVIGETKTSETWARTYLLRPAVFPADVYSVMILKPERAAEGVSNVWALGVAADSTVRKIVTSGDSMARSAALREAQARQAAQDSIRRDSARIFNVDTTRHDTTGRLPRRDTTRRVPAPAAPAPRTPRDTTSLPNTI